MIQIYYGNGKGKTTAAAGQALRILHYGGKVVFVCFLKIIKSGELQELLKYKNVKIIKGKFTHPLFYSFSNRPKKLKIRKEELNLLKVSNSYLKKIKDSKHISLIVLDEILNCLKEGFVKESELLNFLKRIPQNVEVVLTGRFCPPKLKKIASLITQFCEEKHWYKDNVKARKGIEY